MMKQQDGTGQDAQENTPDAPLSDRSAQRNAVIEPSGEGIRVCGGHAFDPYRFQEFYFSPAFREKMMKASLPLLDLRELHGDQSGQGLARRVGPNDVTQPAHDRRPQPGSGSEISASDTSRSSSRAKRLQLAHEKARKSSGTSFGGKPGKKWKFLLFGSFLAVLGSATE
jgi:hypothetical protein